MLGSTPCPPVAPPSSAGCGSSKLLRVEAPWALGLDVGEVDEGTESRDRASAGLGLSSVPERPQ